MPGHAFGILDFSELAKLSNIREEIRFRCFFVPAERSQSTAIWVHRPLFIVERDSFTVHDRLSEVSEEQHILFAMGRLLRTSLILPRNLSPENHCHHAV